MNLHEAVQLCRELNEYLAPAHYHVALTGGVLFKGESAKDVDIIIYPRKANNIQFAKEIVELLTAYGWKFNEYRTPYHHGDTKDVLQFQKDSQIIDVFCLQ